ncbi:MAG: hypothetical protein WAM85_19450 [Terracidiphilus sp.]
MRTSRFLAGITLVLLLCGAAQVMAQLTTCYWNTMQMSRRYARGVPVQGSSNAWLIISREVGADPPRVSRPSSPI